jgi:3-deoxy-D-manno-octulosonate 8-phosphate phosphatase (KDO 8-P phosphatase)
MNNTSEIKNLINGIKLLSCDVDGVMTDGGLYYDEDGREMRRFHVLDGLGIQNLMMGGVEVCIISRSSTKSIAQRAKSLGILHCYLGVKSKIDCMDNLLIQLGISHHEVAHIGDDLNDLELMKAIGLPITVPNGVKEIKEIAKLITEKHGGDGAIREVTDLLLVNRK